MKLEVVSYEALTTKQRQALETIDLPREQILFAGDIFGALHSFLTEREGFIRGFALLVDDTPRGFFLLKTGRHLPPWADQDAATFHAFMIDSHWQGLGLGKACLEALPQLVRRLWPQVRQLMLSVDAENLAARGLYLKLGWEESGDGYRGRVGYERRMTLRLDSPAATSSPNTRGSA